jgi:hypothetical protein
VYGSNFGFSAAAALFAVAVDGSGSRRLVDACSSTCSSTSDTSSWTPLRPFLELDDALAEAAADLGEPLAEDQQPERPR